MNDRHFFHPKVVPHYFEGDQHDLLYGMYRLIRCNPLWRSCPHHASALRPPSLRHSPLSSVAHLPSRTRRRQHPLLSLSYLGRRPAVGGAAHPPPIRGCQKGVQRWLPISVPSGPWRALQFSCHCALATTDDSRLLISHGVVVARGGETHLPPTVIPTIVISIEGAADGCGCAQCVLYLQCASLSTRPQRASGLVCPRPARLAFVAGRVQRSGGQVGVV
jgi:hypothetical protein